LLSYPSTIALSTRTLTHLSGLIRAHRRAVRSPWRRLEPGQQALLVLAHLRNGDTYARLASGFGIGVATVCRYVHEVVELLAATAPTLTQVMRRVVGLAYAILDGTLIPIDRLSGPNDRRFYAGKHRRHGVNVQVLADPRGRLVWVSAALPGSVHDLSPRPRHRRRTERRRGGHLRRQGLPRSARRRRRAVLRPQPARTDARGQPGPRQDPGHR
jgi:hypothetical protein